MGFSATFLDSSKGECPGACSAHGTCDTVTGVCACGLEWVGADCSVSAPTVLSGVAQSINSLEVGKWQYFRFEVQHC